MSLLYGLLGIVKVSLALSEKSTTYFAPLSVLDMELSDTRVQLAGRVMVNAPFRNEGGVLAGADRVVATVEVVVWGEDVSLVLSLLSVLGDELEGFLVLT